MPTLLSLVLVAIFFSFLYVYCKQPPQNLEDSQRQGTNKINNNNNNNMITEKHFLKHKLKVKATKRTETKFNAF